MNEIKQPRRRSSKFKKQWIGKSASRKSLKRYCNEVWAELIKAKDNHICFLCGSDNNLNSHHLITRKWTATAFEPQCGITLCAGCHSFRITSAHVSPWVLDAKLKSERPSQYRWYLENRAKVTGGNQPKADYAAILKALLAEFETVSPVKLERGKYFRYTEGEESQIVHEYRDLLASTAMVAEKWKCSTACIYGILERHGVERRTEGRMTLHRERLQALCGHTVCKIDSEGNVVGEYFSMNEAAKQHGTCINAIRNCVKGKSKSSCGFRWMLKRDLPATKE